MILGGLKRLAERLTNREKPWLREITKCQDEIAALDPFPHYLTAYRKDEIAYWYHLLRWLYEDGKRYPFKRCLDIGCAYGTLALFCRRVLSYEVACTDFVDTYTSKTLIDKYHIRFAVNNIERDPFPWKEKFDIVIFSEVLEHLNFHPVPTLRKISGLLSEEGLLYLSTPDASSWGRVTKYYKNYADMPCPEKGRPIIDDHVYVYSKDELLEVIDEAGLQVERLDYSKVHAAENFNLALSRKPGLGP